MLRRDFFLGGGGGGGISQTTYMYFVRVYIAAAMHILVNKSHNNAVITNDVFLLVYVYVIILFVLCT